jgi:hypothetical protein
VAAVAHDEDALRRRIDDLEQRVAALADRRKPVSDEIRTRRLVIVNRDGAPRVVAEVRRGTAEIRVVHPDSRAEVVLHAGCPELPDAPPSCGLHVRVEGDSLVEIDAAPGSDGMWRVAGHAGTPALVSAVPAPPPPPRTARRPPPAAPGPSGS